MFLIGSLDVSTKRNEKQDSTCNTERAHSKTAARLEEHPVCSEQEKVFSVSCLEIDSDDDCDEDVIESPNFCTNSYLAPPAVTLKKCSKCQISQYCSISCQKENWGQHKGNVPLLSPRCIYTTSHHTHPPSRFLRLIYTDTNNTSQPTWSILSR